MLGLRHPGAAALLVATVVLVVAPASALAGGPTTQLVVVAADGRGVWLPLSEAAAQPLSSWPFGEPARPAGGYLRLFPLWQSGSRPTSTLPAEPGRYYPRSQALCFSWLPRVGHCIEAASSLRRLIAATHLSALFRQPPTFVAGMTNLGARFFPGNTGAALELAFDLPGTPQPPPGGAYVPLRLRWSGPRAASRPTVVRLTARGIYADGALHRAPAALWTFAIQNYGQQNPVLATHVVAYRPKPARAGGSGAPIAPLAGTAFVLAAVALVGVRYRRRRWPRSAA